MKKILLGFLTIGLISCNNSTDNSGNVNNEGSEKTGMDTVGDTRGMRGTGVDNSGGTPGPGTITDTFQGKTDTADHTSRRDSLK